MRENPGAITYIEMDVVNMKQMKFVKLRHRTGSIVKADVGFLSSGVVSAQATEVKSGVNSLTAVDFGANWLILLPIYIALPKKALNDEKMVLALHFIFWIFNKGDDTIEQPGLVPLPVQLQTPAVKFFAAFNPPTVVYCMSISTYSRHSLLSSICVLSECLAPISRFVQ
jgi:ABC-type phosphate transport system substrate-binding protein